MRQAGYLRQLIEPAVTALGYELVGVEYASQGRGTVLRVYIDRPEGVSVVDCERVSHQVSGVLDVEDPIHSRYALEVSSPGLDRPLFTARDFARFAGSPVRLRLSEPLNGRRNFSGVLKGVQGEHVIVVEEETEHRLPLERIDKARLVPEI